MMKSFLITSAQVHLRKGSLYFGGGGLILNICKLSLINLYRVNYLKEAFNFWFQELCYLVT